MKTFVVVLLIFMSVRVCADSSITVGSKKFTESVVLGDIAERLLDQAGFEAIHKQGMGGTIILWQALKSGGIDLYPEYTGTINEEILKASRVQSKSGMINALKAQGVGMTDELGFNNTYALVMRKSQAEKLRITKISDLAKHPNLVVGVTHEFLYRKDGWNSVSARYNLRMNNVKGVEHTVGYAALRNGAIDVKDAYSTDAKIAEYKLSVLQDDLQFFPQYKAVFLYRLDAPSEAVAAVKTLAGKIDEPMMIRMNAEAERTKDYSKGAAMYFQQSDLRKDIKKSVANDIAKWTLQHLKMVSISLLIAILAGIPLGVAAGKPGWLSQFILGTVGIVQTIPSLALLALLVPLMGINPQTAIVALFLYSLLPIVRNTATGLQNIPPQLRESATALGLEPSAQLFKVYLPMASRSILAGIKTSAVINVGTATLAALIGAGGLGTPIISGLDLADNNLILQGALPAALLALAVQCVFDFADRYLIPRGLRLSGG